MIEDLKESGFDIRECDTKYKSNIIMRNLRLINHILNYDFIINTELPKLYNTTFTGIWPRTHTITVIETIATGLPVIITSYNPASILLNNQSALGFERENIDSLLEKISMSIKDTTIKDKISSYALKLVKKKALGEI